MKAEQYALSFLRVTIGVILLLSGVAKISDPKPMTQMVGMLGFIPDPATFISILGPVEIIVGILMVIGLFTRYASIFIALFMVSNLLVFGIPVAPALRKLPVFPLIQVAVMKDLVILGGALTLAFAGQQAPGLDRILLRHKSKAAPA